jgi:hypothetical protein
MAENELATVQIADFLGAIHGIPANLLFLADLSRQGWESMNVSDGAFAVHCCRQCDGTHLPGAEELLF